jgi:hypothetical protein
VGTATSIFWVGQIQAVHELDILVNGLDLKAGIEGFFFADRADRVPLIVVRWVDQCLIRQHQQLAEDRIVLGPWIAVLEICAARAANEQRVPCEHAIRH